MGRIRVYNRTVETHNGSNNYPIYRPSILGNPYTDVRDRKTKALYICKDRDEAIDRYANYFDIMYNSNIEFRRVVDEIYNKYKNGEDVWLECYCKPKRCHGDVIVDKLRQRLVKETLKKNKI